jgi:hypothetical protein
MPNLSLFLFITIAVYLMKQFLRTVLLVSLISSAPRLFRCASVYAFMVIALYCSACRREPNAPDNQNFAVSVRVEFPETFNQRNAQGAIVRLRSTERGTTDSTTTNADGVANFTNIANGSYDLTASRSLSASEAQELTGIPQQSVVTLTASQAALVLNSAPSAPIILRLGGVPLGTLLIKEVYFAGSQTRSGATYIRDQFCEIYNRQNIELKHC